MSLLREIQKEATDKSISLSDLLRKCLILARRLKSKEFERWVNLELNGYERAEHIPIYRVLRDAHLKGDFVGPFGYRNIASLNFSSTVSHDGFHEALQKLKDAVTTLELRQKIAIFEDLVNGSDNTNFRIILAQGQFERLAFLLQGPNQCREIWYEIPRAKVIAITDSVRTGILRFAMDIEEQNPNAGEVQGTNPPIEPETVKNIFNQNFHAPVGNVAAGSHDFQQTATITPVDKQLNLNIDWGRLASELPLLRQSLVLQATEPEHYQAIGSIVEAEKAIEADDKPKAIEALRKAGNWVGNAATNIGTTLAAEVIKKILMPGP